MNKICVYTCITGDYDKVNELSFKEKGIDYYLFTNNKSIKSNTWKVIYIENGKLDNIRLARKMKVLGNDITNKYEITVWIDGASYIKKSVKEFIRKYCDFNENSLVGFKHGLRDSVFLEAIECIKLKKDNKSIIERQIEKYKQMNFDDNNGLIESTIIIRKSNDKVLKKTMKDWFSEIKKYSYRDQLSFNYVADKNNLKFKLLNMNVFDNEYFGWKKHNIKKDLTKYVVYFDYEKEYDCNAIYIDNYEIKDYHFKANFKVLRDCKEIKFEFANCCGIKFDNLEINARNMNNYNLVNYTQYLDIKLFNNEIPTVFIYGNFKKEDDIIIKIDMFLMKDEQYIDLLNRFNILLLEKNNKKESIFNRIKLKILK